MLKIILKQMTTRRVNETSTIRCIRKKYEAEIAAADATIKIYLTNSVGIGEHPQHLEEIDKLLQKIVDAEEKLKALLPFRL